MAQSPREWPRSLGRQTISSTSEATTSRSVTTPSAPARGNSSTATDEPNCSETIPPMTSATDPSRPRAPADPAARAASASAVITSGEGGTGCGIPPSAADRGRRAVAPAVGAADAELAEIGPSGLSGEAFTPPRYGAAFRSVKCRFPCCYAPHA